MSSQEGTCLGLGARHIPAVGASLGFKAGGSSRFESFWRNVWCHLCITAYSETSAAKFFGTHLMKSAFLLL